VEDGTGKGRRGISTTVSDVPTAQIARQQAVISDHFGGGGAYNALAAFFPASKRLLLVSTNWDAVMSNDLDLSALTGIPSSSTVYRTTVNQ
jgi:hypothetical protein